MPQISQLVSTFGSQLFWLALTFGLVYLVIGRMMLPKVQSTIDMRDKQISDDLEAAKTAHAKADEIEEAYKAKQAANRDAAQAVTAEAKATASAAAEIRLKAEDAKIAAQLADAETSIASQRDAALDEIHTAALEATQEIVAKLTGAKITKAKADKAVKGALANV